MILNAHEQQAKSRELGNTSFEVPEKVDIGILEPGRFVKIAIQHGDIVERVWAKIIRNDTFDSGTLFIQIDNEPVLGHGIKLGHKGTIDWQMVYQVLEQEK